jgi:hypothetical protein
MKTLSGDTQVDVRRSSTKVVGWDVEGEETHESEHMEPLDALSIDTSPKSLLSD